MRHTLHHLHRQIMSLDGNQLSGGLPPSWAALAALEVRRPRLHLAALPACLDNTV